MTLGSLDAKGIGRYDETTPIGPTWSEYMNEALDSVSEALPQLIAASDAARDAYWGTPATGPAQLALQARGAETIRTDKGWTERYYGLYNSGTNPGGAPVAGWYPVSGKLPKARITKTVAQNTSGAPGTFTALLFDAETYDDAGLHSTVALTSRITIPAGVRGLANMNASVRLNTTTGTLSVQFAKNGVLLGDTAKYDLGNATLLPLVGFTSDIEVVPGDYLEVHMSSNTATVPVVVGNCFFEFTLIGPR